MICPALGQLDDENRMSFKFVTLKDVLTDEVVEAIEALPPGKLLDMMPNGPIDPGAGK